jgi:hypothetical protein
VSASAPTNAAPPRKAAVAPGSPPAQGAPARPAPRGTRDLGF